MQRHRGSYTFKSRTFNGRYRLPSSERWPFRRDTIPAPSFVFGGTTSIHHRMYDSCGSKKSHANTSPLHVQQVGYATVVPPAIDIVKNDLERVRESHTNLVHIVDLLRTHISFKVIAKLPVHSLIQNPCVTSLCLKDVIERAFSA